MDELERAMLLQKVANAIGMAVWQCQELENALASYLVIRVQAYAGIGLEKGELLLREANRKPMGLLLKELQRAGVIPLALEERLLSMVAERNWATHRIAREHRGILHKPTIYDEVMERLEHVAGEALALQEAISCQIERYVATSGVSNKDVMAEAAKLLRQWHDDASGEVTS